MRGNFAAIPILKQREKKVVQSQRRQGGNFTGDGPSELRGYRGCGGEKNGGKQRNSRHLSQKKEKKKVREMKGYTQKKTQGSKTGDRKIRTR